MATSNSTPFTSDGNINPEWMQAITNRDAIMSENAAFFLSGEKLKPEVQCCVQNCVMPNRLGSWNDPVTKQTEYNPMMLCFFCNRTFHTGCLDLDANIIEEETVPWCCKECKMDLLNKHCQEYFRATGYKVKLIQRRAKLLLTTATPEKEADLQGEINFLHTDRTSFERRALQIMSEEDPESLSDPSSINPLVLRQVMRARVDKRKAQETAERFKRELEKNAKEISDLKRLMAQSQQVNASGSQLVQNTTLDESVLQSTTLTVPSFLGIQHSSTMHQAMGSTSTAQVLTTHYTGQNRSANIERNDFVYRPQDIRPQTASNPSNDDRYENGGQRSSQISMNANDLSALLSRLALAQERTEDRHLLEARRRAMPKMTEFNGDESKWLTFKQDVERYRKNCKFDDETVKLYVRGALKGDAYNIVRDIFDFATLDVIMATLKSAYGDEMRMVRSRSEELKNFKLGATLYKSDAVKLQAAIQAYFAACNYANVGYINTNVIAESIFCQFNSEDRQRCKEFYRFKNPTCTTIVMDVQTVYDYLMNRMPLLDDAPIKKKTAETEVKKAKSFQVQSVTLPNSSNDSYKFEIKDKNRAPYIGYDLTKVALIKRECDICGSFEHYALQCPSYREKVESDRLKLIYDKKLCKNCLLTSSHRAVNCDVKASCGFRVDKANRCCSKHHISVHEIDSANQKKGYKSPYKRRSNARINARNAKQKIDDAKKDEKAQPTSNSEAGIKANIAFHTLDPKEAMRRYEVLSVGNTLWSTETPKSVKVFRIKFWGPKGHVIALAVGDSGSEATLMRDDLREALGIVGKSETVTLEWADKTTKTCQSTYFDMQVQGMGHDAIKYNLSGCFALKDLSLPQRTLDMDKLKAQFPHLRNVPFDGYKNEEPVILIGAPHAHLIEGCELLENGENGPIAVRTKLGWSVYGGRGIVDENEPGRSVNEISIQEDDPAGSDNEPEKEVSNKELHEMLERHNSVESLGIKSSLNQYTLNEKKAIEILEEEMKRLDNGFIEVPLLWNRKNKEIPQLPNNYPMVLQRQLAQERKLEKSPAMLKAYNDNVSELLSQGFLREANESDMKGNWKNVWYLPMTLVVNENKNPPKMRNVYDASCVYKGSSLNKNLLKGPDLLVNILQPLMKMRMNKIAFTADVKSMFNMVKICERDQQCQRVLWRENSNMPMKTYVSTVMMFGPTSSPVTSQYVKNETAKLWMNSHPKAAKTLIDYTYMDDVLTSESNVETALKVAEDCISICKSINWQLISFQSNSIELLKSLPESAVKKDAIPLPESEPDTHVTKVLGCFWNTVEDCFEFKLERNIFIQLVKDFDQRPTKRDQASTLARIYDVLGLISFYTIRGKILLQRSWESKIDWDQEIDDKASKEWKNWVNQLNEVALLKFPRRFTQLDALEDAEEVILHVFCDAGTEAFGAVAYITAKSKERIDSTIAMAKAKVTPLRLKTKTTIKEMPRLELMAALIAARLSKTISSMLHEIKLKRKYWCDSEVVLRWILDPNQKLMKYAIGPVEEILEISERSDWSYVPTELNVADLCTKMKKIDFSSTVELWMNGPEFIRSDETRWPELPKKLLMDDCLMANNIFLEKLKFSTYELPPIDCPIAGDSMIDRLSAAIKASWPKLVRAVARALKIYIDAFIPLIANKQFTVHGNIIRLNAKSVRELNRLTGGMEYLSPRDLERAEHFIIRKIQRDEFPDEYKALKSEKCIKNAMMLQLNVFMDKEGIIRINSRANLNSELFPQQFSPLLPRKNVYVTSLLAYYHQKHGHISTESQIAEIRSKVWIPQLKMALRSIKGRCNWCKLKNARPYSPEMAPLPYDRVNPELKPFEVTGIDVLGPLKPTVNGNIKKIYILIFACTLTRYIHLHLLDSLESLRVLEAIVTFWTAYGPVRKFVSDNGTNFIRTAKILKEDYEKAQVFAKQQAAFGTKLSELYRVEWQFNAVHAPWFGGLYERLIKEVKRSLATTLDRRKINRVELNIAVQEAAHRINCRPLTENALEAEDREVLTPHHLAKNRSGWPLLPGIHKNVYSTTPDRSIYRRGRAVADEIMRKFTARYLPVLAKRTKWHKHESPPKIGDLVLVIEPNKTRKEWQRAKIVKIHLGKDGVARVADVEMANGKVKKNRALRNLAKLNFSTSLNEETNSEGKAASTVLTVISNLKTGRNLPNEANFIVDIQENFVQREKLNFSSKDPEMTASKTETDSKMLLIEGVSRYMTVSDFILELAPELMSIVGAIRIYDYRNKLPSDTIATYLLDDLEYDRLMRARHEVNVQNGLRLSFPDLIAGSVYIPGSMKTIDDDRIAQIPKPLGVFDLPVMKSGTSIYAAKLVKTFEQQMEVTGFKWCVDGKRRATRNFGFMYTNDRQSVLALADKTFPVLQSSVTSRVCDSTLVLLHARHKYMLNERRKAILSADIVEANWLNANLLDVRDPALSNPLNAERDDGFDLRAQETLVVTIDNDDNNVHDPPAGPSRTVSLLDDRPTSSSSKELQRSVTEPVMSSASRQSKSSKYLRMTFKGNYPFNVFYKRVMRFVKEFQVVTYSETASKGLAFIEFEDKKRAKRFKTTMEELRQDKETKIRYDGLNGENTAEKAKHHEVKPEDDSEVIYVIHKNMEVFQRKFGEDYAKFTPAPQHVTK